MGSLNLKLIYLYLLIQRKNRSYLWGRGVTTNKLKFQTLICHVHKSSIKSKSMYILVVLLFSLHYKSFFSSIEHQCNEHFNWYNWLMQLGKKCLKFYWRLSIIRAEYIRNTLLHHYFANIFLEHIWIEHFMTRKIRR